ncbi:Phox/Bem1p [Macleaya cordata]|uniref:Phox/Bem1p n=1 Tax=Macleaya cordata TaxID=56857 RepID=A0A200QAC2_MACCD|nr:Phox/Bem1p [Macleaya cordata]
MENSYSSYADSGDSSPRSREIDCENHSWDEPASYKVKLMCSYGGKIQPRPHDNQLTYVGGETKILAVDRGIKFPGIINKVSVICDADVTLKYQLPGEDLDALVSVTNDEDLEHMMVEFDRLYRASTKPARLRLFLFPVKSSAPSSFGAKDPKTNQQWFVDALNSAQIQQSIDSSSSPPASETPSNPDFLFGLDKGFAPTSPVSKLQDPTLESTVLEPLPVEIPVRLDSGREDRYIGEEQVVSPVEIQRQIHELQRLQIGSQEQSVFYRNNDDNLTRAYPGDYYVPKIPENTVPVGGPLKVPVAPVPPSVSVPAAYWPERHITAPPPPVSGADHPVYLIPAPSGYYQPPTTVRKVAGQGYYAMPRDVYREPPVYNVAPQQAQQRMVAGYGESVGMVRPPVVGGGIAMADGSYTQVAYDSAGRQVYYTAAPGGVIPSSFPTVTAGGAMDLRQQIGPIISNQEGKIPIPKPTQASV